MTPEQIIIVNLAVAVIVIIGQYLHARHDGKKRYAEGWADGWDACDAQWYSEIPETPEPQGRHHGLSQPEDWNANDLTEFLPPPPLPKRTPKARA